MFELLLYCMILGLTIRIQCVSLLSVMSLFAVSDDSFEQQCMHFSSILDRYVSLHLFTHDTNLQLNPLYSENSLMSTSANCEDPDEMQHHAAFHQGPHYLL